MPKQHINLDKSVLAPVTHYPADNTNAVATITGESGKRIVINSVKYSYDATPTGGLVSIAYTKGGSAVTESLDEVFGGPKRWPMDEELVVDEGENAVVTVAAGGAGVGCNVIVSYYLING